MSDYHRLSSSSPPTNATSNGSYDAGCEVVDCMDISSDNDKNKDEDRHERIEKDNTVPSSVGHPGENSNLPQHRLINPNKHDTLEEIRERRNSARQCRERMDTIFGKAEEIKIECRTKVFIVMEHAHKAKLDVFLTEDFDIFPPEKGKIARMGSNWYTPDKVKCKRARLSRNKNCPRRNVDDGGNEKPASRPPLSKGKQFTSNAAPFINEPLPHDPIHPETCTNLPVPKGPIQRAPLHSSGFIVRTQSTRESSFAVQLQRGLDSPIKFTRTQPSPVTPSPPYNNCRLLPDPSAPSFSVNMESRPVNIPNKQSMARVQNSQSLGSTTATNSSRKDQPSTPDYVVHKAFPKTPANPRPKRHHMLRPHALLTPSPSETPRASLPRTTAPQPAYGVRKQRQGSGGRYAREE